MNQPDLPFGGITVAFGDFQQTHPIIPEGTKEQIVKYQTSRKSS